MKPEIKEPITFSEAFKEKLILLVMYQNQSAKEIAISYRLPNFHILLNWITNYKKKLEKGAITLATMDPKEKNDLLATKQRIKQLEKALEKANILIYGLNSMIDYAEKELKIPIRKKRVTKQ